MAVPGLAFWGCLLLNRRLSRIFGFLLCILAIAFVLYALRHPEASFPFPLPSVYAVYGIYAAITLFLLVAPFKGKK